MNLPTLIFDCDGVIVDSEIIYNTVERQHLAKLGLHYNLKEYQNRFLGISQSDFLDQLHHDYQKLNKGEFPSHFADTVKQQCLKRFQKQLSSFPGLTDLLQAFPGKKAVASSSSLELLEIKLNITDQYQYFCPHIYSSEQVNRGKPFADIFLYTATQLDSKAEHCIVIEDSVNGVTAGLSAGMEVWGFTGGSHVHDGLGQQLINAGAKRIFSDYKTMPIELGLNLS